MEPTTERLKASLTAEFLYAKGSPRPPLLLWFVLGSGFYSVQKHGKYSLYFFTTSKPAFVLDNGSLFPVKVIAGRAVETCKGHDYEVLFVAGKGAEASVNASCAYQRPKSD